MTRHLPTAAALAGALALTWLAGLGPGYRAGLWGYRAAYGSLKALVPLGGLAALAGLAGLVVGPAGTRPRALAIFGLAAGLAAAAFPLRLRAKARAVPPIHDISTDLADPPAFVDVLAARAGAENPAEYGGPEVARQQREAYPDLQGQNFAGDVPTWTRAAAETARRLGWELVASRPEAGRVEATATTPWWGYRDDVVVRVAAVGGGVRVDVRSVSRVGTSDLGANAARIRRFFEALTPPGR